MKSQTSILECYATPRWQRLAIGQPVNLVVHISNLGKHDAMIAEGRGIHALGLVAMRNGVRLDFAGDTMQAPFKNDGVIHGLPPGTSETKSFELSELFDMSFPGTYDFAFSVVVMEQEHEHAATRPDAVATATVIVAEK